MTTELMGKAYKRIEAKRGKMVESPVQTEKFLIRRENRNTRFEVSRGAIC
jgi:hypothetical protein